MHKVELTLQEPKKWSGKYVVVGTEEDQYPQIHYLPKRYFPNEQLPKKVIMTIEAAP